MTKRQNMKRQNVKKTKRQKFSFIKTKKRVTFGQFCTLAMFYIIIYQVLWICVPIKKCFSRIYLTDLTLSDGWTLSAVCFRPIWSFWFLFDVLEPEGGNPTCINGFRRTRAIFIETPGFVFSWMYSQCEFHTFIFDISLHHKLSGIGMVIIVLRTRRHVYVFWLQL